MAEDFTTYTEVDGSGVITVSAPDLVVSGQPRNTDGYVYKDYGASAFGDFTAHDFDGYITGSSQNYAFGVIWGVTNSVGTYNTWADGIYVNFYKTSGGAYECRIQCKGNGLYSSAFTPTAGVAYYFRTSRSGTTATCKIYGSAADRTANTNVLSTLTVTCTTTAFRYHYAFSSLNSAEANLKFYGGSSNYSNENSDNSGIAALGVAGSFQRKCIYDGNRYWLFYAKGTSIYYKSSTDFSAWTSEATLPSGPTITDGYDFSVDYAYHSGVSFIYVAWGALIRYYYNGDGTTTLTASTVSGTPTAPFTGTRSLPSVKFHTGQGARYGSVYALSREASTYKIDFTWSQTNFWGPLGWASVTNVHTGTNANVAGTILSLGLYDDIYVVYSDNGTLYGKYYNTSTNTFGSAQTIATDLGSYLNWSACAMQNGKVLVTYKDASNNLRYAVRAAGSGGTWGATAQMVAATVNVQTVTANLNTAEEAICFYVKSNAIRYIIWNGSTWASDTSLGTTTGTADSISTVPMDGEEFVVAYKDLALFAPKKLTRSVAAVDSPSATTSGEPYFGVVWNSKNTVTVGTKTFQCYLKRNLKAYIRAYDSGTGWGSEYELTGRYWDTHNYPYLTKDASNYLYVLAGGRAWGGSVHNIQIWKSTYAADHGSFSISGWTTEELTASAGRGYKHVAVDQAGTIYVTWIDNLHNAWIRQKVSGGSWSADVKIVDIVGADDAMYIGDVIPGREPSGQKSLHVTWSLAPDTAALNATTDVYYIRLIPGASNTYTAKKADGTAQTLPASEFGAGNGCDRAYAGTIDVLAHMDINESSDWGDPLFTFATRDVSNNLDAIKFVRYSSGWQAAINIDTGSNNIAFPQLLWETTDNKIWVLWRKIYSGYWQLALATSEDGGATFTGGAQQTSSSYHKLISPLSTRTSLVQNMPYAVLRSQVSSEVVLGDLQVVATPVPVFMHHYRKMRSA